MASELLLNLMEILLLKRRTGTEDATGGRKIVERLGVESGAVELSSWPHHESINQVGSYYYGQP